MDYRREIDGLRAVAVLPVIGFHAGFSVVSGGFVGVDIFFVISGYLITAMIIEERRTGRFSLLGFYERRARRILPALLVVMAACIPFAWAWMTPADMRGFSQSVAATSVFGSNWLFFRTSGYFESAAEYKPLLHTWSLSVEEQFYVLFPALLLVVWRWGSARILMALLGALLLSLTLAELALPWSPTAVFYLLPTRAWELALGACLAFYRADGRYPQPGPAGAQWGSLAGLLSILAAVLLFDRDLPVPGVWTLLPTLGAALIILCARPGTVAGRLLGSRWMVAIGLMSYSAYLWHQPLFAFARYASVQPPGTWRLLGLIVLTFALAYASWRWLERPFRSRRAVGTRALLLYTGGGSLALLAFGGAGYATDGFAWRFRISDPEVQALAAIRDPAQHFRFRELLRHGRCHSVPLERLEAQGCIDVRSRNILLIGDSYAANLYAGLDAVRNARHPHVGIVQATDNNGPPFESPRRTDEGKSLIEAQAERITLAARLRPERIVVTWMIYGENAPRSSAASADGLDRTLDRLLAASPRSEVIVVGPFPRWSHSLQRQMINYHLRTGERPPRYLRDGLVDRDRDWDRFFRHRLPRPQVRYVSAHDMLCHADGCLTHVGGALTDLTALDWGHLTAQGSRVLAGRLEPAVFDGL